MDEKQTCGKPRAAAQGHQESRPRRRDSRSAESHPLRKSVRQPHVTAAAARLGTGVATAGPAPEAPSGWGDREPPSGAERKEQRDLWAGPKIHRVGAEVEEE